MLDDGRELWRLGGLNGPTALNRRAFDVTFRFVASPAFGSGRLIIPTAKPPHGSPEDRRQPVGRPDRTGRRDRLTVDQTPDVSIPLIHDGLVYLLHKDGKLQCIDLETGQELI